MPDGTVHSEVRFVFLRGEVAVWHVDMLNWSGHRVFRAANAKFLKRKTAREPHHVLLPDQSLLIVKPLYAGGACCSPHPLKEYTSEKLLSQSFATTPITEPA